MNCPSNLLIPTPGRQGHASSGAPTSAPRILVVDDDHILRELHSAILYLENYEVETAEDGQEALERLGAKSFDLMITDRTMPRLDGVSLIRKLRAAGNQIPIVMVSGSLAHSELPPDVAGEVAVALPKPALVAQVLAAVAFGLRGTKAAGFRPRTGSFGPGTADAVRPAGLPN